MGHRSRWLDKFTKSKAITEFLTGFLEQIARHARPCGSSSSVPALSSSMGRAHPRWEGRILGGKGVSRHNQSDGADLDDTVDALFAKPKGK